MVKVKDRLISKLLVEIHNCSLSTIVDISAIWISVLVLVSAPLDISYNIGIGQISAKIQGYRPKYRYIYRTKKELLVKDVYVVFKLCFQNNEEHQYHTKYSWLEC